MVCAGVLVGVALAPLFADAQAARRRTARVESARNAFALVIVAAVELVRMEIVPADANGQVRAWEARWPPLLERIAGVAQQVCWQDAFRRDRHACDERCALLQGAQDVLLAARVANRDDVVHVDLPARLAARRLLADEIARRRASSLSCFDVPMVESIEADVATAIDGTVTPADISPLDRARRLFAIAGRDLLNAADRNRRAQRRRHRTSRAAPQ